jgi:hypothetical protein
MVADRQVHEEEHVVKDAVARAELAHGEAKAGLSSQPRRRRSRMQKSVSTCKFCTGKYTEHAAVEAALRGTGWGFCSLT